MYINLNILYIIILLNLFSFLIFIPIILISSLIIFYATSWFSQWIIIEINLISFLRLLIFDKKIDSSISISYYLIQSFNSYIFIMISINLNFINFYIDSIFSFIINLRLLTKIGLPPFYLWYIKIIKNLNWINLFYLITIQKIIPLIIISNLINFKEIILAKFNILNLLLISFFRALLGLQNLNLKILIAYSSIIQISWIIILIYLREVIYLRYLLIYSLISLTLVIIFLKFNISYLNDLNLLKCQYNWIYLILIFTTISIARIPPFFGFIIKWISIQLINNFYNFILILLIILNSLIRIYFYLRLRFISYLIYSYSIKSNFLKINFLNYFNIKIIYLVFLIFTLLILYEIF